MRVYVCLCAQLVDARPVYAKSSSVLWSFHRVVLRWLANRRTTAAREEERRASDGREKGKGDMARARAKRGGRDAAGRGERSERGSGGGWTVGL